MTTISLTLTPEVQALLAALDKQPENLSLEKAWNTIVEKLRQNSQNLWGWHCNLVLAMQDEGIDHKTANLAAALWMKRHSQIDVKQLDQWKILEKYWAPKQENKAGTYIWHSGPPPHIGWWNASINKDTNIWRWWNGKNWSFGVDGTHADAEYAYSQAINNEFGSEPIYWTWAWPKGARVARINPDTGAITGEGP